MPVTDFWTILSSVVLIPNLDKPEPKRKKA